jgi:hypothetical protein
MSAPDVWPKTIPAAVRREAFELAHAILGSDTIRRFGEVGQEAVLAHIIAVGGACMYTARQAGFGEAAAERIGRKGIVHDVGKPNVPGISDSGVWDQDRRLYVREEHCIQGGIWTVKNAARLPDADALQFATENHHTEVPKPEDYRNMDGPLPEWWGDLHLLQGCDRLHALTSRPYVLQREGAITPAGAVGLALAADPRAESPALPPTVELDGRRLDLAVGLGQIAEVMTVA